MNPRGATLADRLQIHVVTSRMFAENAYILRRGDRSECLLVDPGLDADDILQFLAQHQLTPTAILNTHGHADHIAGNAPLKARFPAAPLVIGAGDASKLTDPHGNLSAAYGVPITSPPADRVVREGDRVVAAGLELEVLETPGHSIGHVVFVLKQQSPWIVIGGDVLFAGSIGRTDFPDGSFDQLANSIHTKLFTLPDDTVVLPGHGPSTTIVEEREHNPFVGRGA